MTGSIDWKGCSLLFVFPNSSLFVYVSKSILSVIFRLRDILFLTENSCGIKYKTWSAFVSGTVFFIRYTFFVAKMNAGCIYLYLPWLFTFLRLGYFHIHFQHLQSRYKLRDFFASSFLTFLLQRLCLPLIDLSVFLFVCRLFLLRWAISEFWSTCLWKGMIQDVSQPICSPFVHVSKIFLDLLMSFSDLYSISSGMQWSSQVGPRVAPAGARINIKHNAPLCLSFRSAKLAMPQIPSMPGLFSTLWFRWLIWYFYIRSSIWVAWPMNSGLLSSNSSSKYSNQSWSFVLFTFQLYCVDVLILFIVRWDPWFMDLNFFYVSIVVSSHLFM